VKAEFIKTILEITLDHRLRMFHHHVVATIPLICLSLAHPLRWAMQHNMDDATVRSGAKVFPL